MDMNSQVWGSISTPATLISSRPSYALRIIPVRYTQHSDTTYNVIISDFIASNDDAWGDYKLEFLSRVFDT